jgi:hypothetical protein
MLYTYTLTVQLLARQRQNLGGGKPTSGGWSSGWLGIAPPLGELKQKPKLCQLKFINLHLNRAQEHVEAIHKDEFAVDTKSRALCRLNGYRTVYVGH